MNVGDNPSTTSPGPPGKAERKGVPRRNRITRRTVLYADWFARIGIAVGGIGTILSVALVCVFLVWVVVPLFGPAEVTSKGVVELQATAATSENPSDGGQQIAFGTDEFGNLFWSLSSEGWLEVYRCSDGDLVKREQLPGEAALVAWSYEQRSGNLALAYDDATVRLATVASKTDFLSADDLPPALRDLEVGQATVIDQSLVEVMPEGLYRALSIELTLEDPIKLEIESPVVLLDASISSKGKVLAFLTQDGQLRVAQVTERKNLLTGKVTTRLREGVIEIDLADGGMPQWLMLSGLGDNAFLIWPDGTTRRFDTRKATAPVLAETVDLTDGDAMVSSAKFLIGKTSLVVGDTDGEVHIWFRIKPPDATTSDGAELVRVRTLHRGKSPVKAIATSPSARLATMLFEDGTVSVAHTTSEKKLAELSVEMAADSPTSLTMTPRNDGLFLRTDDLLHGWGLNPKHPEITWSSVFDRVWYEGYEKPEYVWQSSSGTNDFEEKYSLVPLIFGTAKATIYSMLFAVPLALLAAIYTSEFLHPRARARVKPTIEVMASLPSVVLGFLAALIVAPLFEGIVPEALTALATIPFALLLGAQLWQLLPIGLAMRWERWRIWMMVAMLPLGIAMAIWLGPGIEKWLFYGDIKAWLDGQIGTGEGGWMFLTLPGSALAVTWGITMFVLPALRRRGAQWSRLRFAVVDLVKFVLATAATIGLSYGIASLLTILGWDARGLYLGTYMQRNSLIVGAIMGFAVIPIIYTISDDALSAVPNSLRAASLGAGATKWQTAIRVVVPTAMSGLFSAMMVGLGRAVGETMIVLMAAGNTPIMDWNVFNGFRTLSANIAVELPEAMINSTHYRMLFLAALVLFLLTFIVNTVAEIVRLRFRKRAFQL